MNDKFRVYCWFHRYDTLHTLSLGTAISAARMHSLIGCEVVRVIDKDEKDVDWKKRPEGVKNIGE